MLVEVQTGTSILEEAKKGAIACDPKILYLGICPGQIVMGVCKGIHHIILYNGECH